MSTRRDSQPDPETPWTQGAAPDSKGEFSYHSEQPGNGSGIPPEPSTYNIPEVGDE